MQNLSVLRAFGVGSVMVCNLSAATPSASVSGQAGLAGAPPDRPAGQAPHQVIDEDRKPPRLRSIQVGGKLDVSVSGAQAVLNLVATDNLSGVHHILVTLRSASSAQWQTAEWIGAFDLVRAEVHIGVDMPVTSENGKWYIQRVELRDANGLIADYDEQALAALGHTTFTVVRGIGDTTLPRPLDGGVNLTPQLSLSEPPPGRPRKIPPRAGVQLKLADEGGAGVRLARLEFCYLGGSQPCFMVEGYDYVRGQNEVTLTMGGFLSRSLDVGPYYARWLTVYDHAGNEASYGGNDLTNLLDNNWIKVLP